MSQSGRGAVYLSASAASAAEWVRGGVVPCHVIEHAAWSIVVPAVGATAVAAPYDDAFTVLASRYVPSRLAPAIGLFHIDDIAAVTARASGRGQPRWALRDVERDMVAGRELPPLSPEDLHRALGSGAPAREIRVRGIRGLWDRTDLDHAEWIVEAATVLGLPGARILSGADTDLGPVVEPGTRAISTFESAIKDVHQ